MTGDVAPYIALLTSQHRSKPKFSDSLTAAVQPLADTFSVELLMQTLFDLDTAVGTQLDVIGQWVGVSRIVNIPLAAFTFSFDDANLGFDLGSWNSPTNASGTSLADDAYRTLIRSRVLNNRWNGSVEDAYAIWDVLFAGTGYVMYIKDNGNLTITLYLVKTGGMVDAVTKALFEGGYLNIKPAGVTVAAYVTDSPPP